MGKRNPLASAFTRVWIIEGRARADREPEFLYYLKMEGMEKNFGGTTPIYEPSKDRYGDFIETGSVRDEEERPSTSLMGRYPRDVKSRVLTLAMRKCAHDVQLHLGNCAAPGVFNDFEKALIWEAVTFESYSTDPLGTLEPGENSKVDETIDISGIRAYEYVPVKYADRTPGGIINEVVDAARCDNPSCGECAELSDGCQKFMGITLTEGGSAGTPSQIIYTLDGGSTWYMEDIDTVEVANSPVGIACVAGYAVVIVAIAADEMHIVDADELDGIQDPDWVQSTAGYVVGGAPEAIDSVGNVGYIVGNSGYVYKITNPPAGVVVVDAGIATTGRLLDVDLLSDEFAVAVGEDGTIVTIDNDIVGQVLQSPVGWGTDLLAILVKSEVEWFAGADDGTFAYTLDAGISPWVAITLPGVAPTAITDIAMSSDSVMWVAATVDTKGEIYVSIDGGNSWTLTPRGAANAMPNNDRINALVVCPFDVDFVAGFGLGFDATDGFIVIGGD